MKASRLPRPPDGRIIRQELRRAQESFRAAKRLLEDGLYADAVSRAYYAMLHATKAALLTKRIEVHSHTAALKMLSLHFIKPGLLESTYGKFFKKAQQDRAKSDYEVLVSIDHATAKEHVQAAQRFLTRIRRSLRLSR